MTCSPCMQQSPGGSDDQDTRNAACWWTLDVLELGHGGRCCQGFGIGLDFFFGADIGQVADDFAGRDAPELVALAARKDCGRNFVNFGGGQDENNMRRRFFQRFQQGIEGLVGKHVNFINNIHLELAL